MPGAILTGFLAALIVFFPRYFYLKFPNAAWTPHFVILSVLIVGMLAALMQKYRLKRREESSDYDGLPDLFIQIHAPFKPDSPLRWAVKGWISFCLSFVGSSVGPEGAAVELMQAAKMKLRARSARWFEQKRRTDASVNLAAGIAAAFGAPFAGFLLPIELGMGGRNIFIVTGALSAFLTIRFLTYTFSLDSLDVNGVLAGFIFSDWRAWVGIVVVGLMAGGVGTALIRFIRYTQEGLNALAQYRGKAQPWLRILVGTALLAFILLMYKAFQKPTWELLENVLWLRVTPSEVALLLFTQILSLSVVLAGFGTIGLFWPLFALGGYLGFCVNHWVMQDLIGFSAAAGLAGASALWGAVLGVPMVGAVLAFEMTQNINILLPCVVAALIAGQVRRFFRTKTLTDKELEARGIFLVEGRSTNVLSAITVREAMVNDHEIVYEQDPVAVLHQKVANARYPFLPVVNTQGLFRGLLTVDMVQDSDEHVTQILEVKDLLYRTGGTPAAVKADDTLSSVVSLFEEGPCVVVVGHDGRVEGLLFVYSIRLAYDREVTKRSFSPDRG
jgi:H+/Cl- antiporter ClcA